MTERATRMAGRGERVVVAMSGGVDSSLAAALLVEAGYDVVGVSMRLWSAGGPAKESGCCSLDDFLDARRVADQLGFPFYVMDFEEDFRSFVVEDFVAEYRRGRTPNPCARCNQFVKFAPLWERARDLGAQRIATGHYARRSTGPCGPELWRGVDAGKDQSYFLFSIGRDVLDHALFPVGELTKHQVREEACRRGLAVAEKADSQEICFVPRRAHPAFVAEYGDGAAPAAGNIVDMDGKLLGRHAGVHNFTIGQRRGLRLGLGGPPQYVSEIDAATATVRVGSREQMISDGMLATQASWLGPPPTAGQRVLLKIRSRFAPQPAVVTEVEADRFTVLAPGGLTAVTPGQAAVLYDGERVVGGGWIERTLRAARGEGHAAGTEAAVSIGGRGGIS